MSKTISFDEKNNGWTSFWSYKPEWMSRLGNNFYSFKCGQLFRHHSEVASKNLFYDNNASLVNYDSYVEFAFNQDPSDVKHFKTMSLESSDSNWDVEIISNLDSGYIDNTHFQTREGEYYAYIRRNEEDLLDFSHISVQGLGTPISRSGNTYTFSSLPSFLSEEDCLYFVKTSDGSVVKVGRLVSFNQSQLTTVVPNPSITIENNAFYFIAKNSEAESFGIKGYFAKVKVKSTGVGTPQDLYSVNSQVFKSFQ
jgi:hypothetical protein